MRALARMWIGAATASIVLLSSLAPAAGSPPRNPAAGAGGTPVPAEEVGSHDVTLLTGDRVTVLIGADGHTTHEVTPAPGRDPVFQAYGDGEDLYVIPDDAAAAVAAGVLERDLFNVRELVRQGLTGDRAGLPLIVTYDGSGPAPAAARGDQLSSIDGAALRLSPDEAGAFWRDLQPPAGPRAAGALGAGVERLWLDREIEVSIDQSVPRIGAPAAWDAGLDGTGVAVAVIDTGVDPQHPDLAGRIVDTANFTDEPDIVDRHGHGTHVASTILGDGTASGGTYTGVAPGASLMAAKAIDASGSGPTSAVIAAMEWAAYGGADIINLSLGSEPTDGTDPSSQAVDTLSAETGALFVAASGNDFQDVHVLAPSAADSALSVGAVDAQDEVPFFSNRGPRRGDAAVKPEITAPGVDIAAARAAGTSLGTPIDDHYTSTSGTSMATPHVAGTAALLAHAHPEWDWQALKDAVVSTAAPRQYEWWQGGAGRVDAARAATQGVYGPAAVNLGVQPFPQDQLDLVTRKLTYTNHTDADVTLELALDLAAFDGGGTGAADLSASTVQIPAGGSAGVTLTVDPAADPEGAYGGLVRASSADGQVSVVTAVSWHNETETYDVAVQVSGHRGGAPTSSVTVSAIRIDGANANDPFTPRNQNDRTDPTGRTGFRLAAGTYHFHAAVTERSAAFGRTTLVVEPEVTVAGPTEVTMDAQEAVNQRPATPERTDTPAVNRTVIRGMPDGDAVSFSLISGGGHQEQYATPTEPVTHGWLESTSQWTFSERLVELAATAPEPVSLDPGYDALSTGPLLAQAPAELPLAYVDEAQPEQVGEVRDKAALVRIPIPDGLNHAQSRSHAVRAARDARDLLVEAGAAAVLAYVDIPGAPQLHGPDVPSTEAPTFTVPYAEGAQLRTLDADGDVTLSLSGHRDPAYAYHVRRDYHERVPAAPPEPIDPDELVRMDTRYHGDSPDLQYESVWSPRGPRDVFSIQSNWPWWGPTARAEYVGEPGDYLSWRRIIRQQGEREDGSVVELTSNAYDVFEPGAHRTDEAWFAAPIRTGAVDHTSPLDRFNDLCENCRDGDGFVPARHWRDGTIGHRQRVDWADSQVRLFQDGEEIPAQTNRSYPWFRLPSEPGTFRLERVDRQPGVPAVRTLAPEIRTSWTFHSAAPEQGSPEGYRCPLGGDTCAFQPLLVVDVDADLDLTNTAPDPRERRGPATVQLDVRHHADGPAVAGARLWTSFDDGQSWQRRPGHDRGEGRFEFYLPARPPDGGSGHVSVRLEAWDVDGNRIEQEITRAWWFPSR